MSTFEEDGSISHTEWDYERKVLEEKIKALQEALNDLYSAAVPFHSPGLDKMKGNFNTQAVEIYSSVEQIERLNVAMHKAKLLVKYGN